MFLKLDTCCVELLFPALKHAWLTSTSVSSLDTKEPLLEDYRSHTDSIKGRAGGQLQQKLQIAEL